MTNKELFCEIVKKAHKQNDAICNLEKALGGIVIEDKNLFSVFNKSDEICGVLVWGDKTLPGWYYELYWNFVLNGYIEGEKGVIVNSAEEFYDFLVKNDETISCALNA